jgi:hypothetical protein
MNNTDTKTICVVVVELEIGAGDTARAWLYLPKFPPFPSLNLESPTASPFAVFTFPAFATSNSPRWAPQPAAAGTGGVWNSAREPPTRARSCHSANCGSDYLRVAGCGSAGAGDVDVCASESHGSVRASRAGAVPPREAVCGSWAISLF